MSRSWCLQASNSGPPIALNASSKACKPVGGSTFHLAQHVSRLGYRRALRHLLLRGRHLFLQPWDLLNRQIVASCLTDLTTLITLPWWQDWHAVSRRRKPRCLCRKQIVLETSTCAALLGSFLGYPCVGAKYLWSTISRVFWNL